MKHIQEFKIFENNEYMSDLNNEIAEIIKKSGYYVANHTRIYYSTLQNKPELISNVYKKSMNKYEDTLLLDLFSFKKLNDNAVNYQLQHFLYPIEMLEMLYDKENVINYKELPFFDELFEIVKRFKKIKQAKKFNL
jgi:hypothetical protein